MRVVFAAVLLLIALVSANELADNTLPNIMNVGRGIRAYDFDERSQIFFFSFNKGTELHYWARSNVYRVPDQLDVFSQPSCAFGASTEAIFTAEATRQSRARSSGVNGSWKKVAFKANRDVKKTKDYLRADDLFVGYAKGECVAFDVILHSSNVSLTSNFLAAVKNLPTAYNYAAYQSFLSEFGTHYMKSATLGGRSWQYSTTSKSFLYNSRTSSAQFGMGVSFASVFGLSNDRDKSSAQYSAYKTDSQTFQAFAEGGQADLFQNWAAWSKTIDLNPVVLDAELGELHEVFNANFAPQITQISDWTTKRDNTKRALDQMAQDLMGKVGPAYWTEWGCGAIQCDSGSTVVAVDFSAQNEGCWGKGNDFEEAKRRLKCQPMFAW